MFLKIILLPPSRKIFEILISPVGFKLKAQWQAGRGVADPQSSPLLLRLQPFFHRKSICHRILFQYQLWQSSRVLNLLQNSPCVCNPVRLFHTLSPRYRNQTPYELHHCHLRSLRALSWPTRGPILHRSCHRASTELPFKEGMPWSA